MQVPKPFGKQLRLVLALMSLGVLAVAVGAAVAQPPPSPGRPRYEKGRELARKGQLAEAVTELREAAKMDQMLFEARNDLAWTLATSADDKVRNPKEALEAAERMVDDIIKAYVVRRQRPGAPAGGDPYAGLPQPPHFYKVTVIRTLAAAYAANGRFEPAPGKEPALAAAAAKMAQADSISPAAVSYATLAMEAARSENAKRKTPETQALVRETQADVKEYKAKKPKRLAKPIG
jgi:hypothetical protein